MLQAYALDAVLTSTKAFRLRPSNLYATTYIVPSQTKTSKQKNTTSSSTSKDKPKTKPNSADDVVHRFPDPTFATIGASGDSFFEVLLKGYLLFGNQTLYHEFTKAYQGIIEHLRVDQFYRVLQVSSVCECFVWFNLPSKYIYTFIITLHTL